jgi:cell division protein FtsX
VVLTLESHKIEKLVAIGWGVQMVATGVVMLMALGA